jgi:dihydroorotate dehydrogenase electron transfer subunit
MLFVKLFTALLFSGIVSKNLRAISMIHDLSCKVLSNRRIGRSLYYLASILSPEISTESQPGQFVMLGLSDRSGIFLRRPYSVCGANGTFEKTGRNTFQILYKIVGKGTHALSQVKVGEKVDILGPLGNPFEISEDTRKSKRQHVIIAGGVGSAPFPLLVHKFIQLQIKPAMLYGGKSRDDLPLRGWFKKHCRPFKICTEDGSMGQKGLVSCLFQGFETQQSNIRIYACGPHGMLKAVTDFSLERGYQAYGSFEERMACGFGVCLGCAIPIKGADGRMSYRHVCHDGPIFKMEEVIFNQP